jgi:hypothetical protein
MGTVLAPEESIVARTLNSNDIVARIDRLEKLGRDLANEASRCQLEEARGGIETEEFREYVNNLLTAVTGLALARGILVAVWRRLEREEPGR